MLRIKDNVDLKILEKYGFSHFKNEGAMVDYYRYSGSIIVRVLKNRIVDYQLPLNMIIKYVTIENLVKDLIKDGLVEKVSEKE